MSDLYNKILDAVIENLKTQKTKEYFFSTVYWNNATTVHDVILNECNTEEILKMLLDDNDEMLNVILADVLIDMKVITLEAVIKRIRSND